MEEGGVGEREGGCSVFLEVGVASALTDLGWAWRRAQAYCGVILLALTLAGEWHL